MSTGHPKPELLVADIGGTHARFAFARAGSHRLLREHELITAEYSDLAGAIESYLDYAGLGRPRKAAIAIANPITSDAVKMTNSRWAFSIKATQKALGLDRLLVINDFVALAYSVPALRRSHFRKIGGGKPVAHRPLALIGPGTGLGVAALVPHRDAWLAVDSEGGHVNAPASDAREAKLIAALQEEIGHVSAERLISGPGLENIYRVLAQFGGKSPKTLIAQEISTQGQSGTNRVARDALDCFCAMLGTLAGDVALTFGARGGLYLGGGILPHLGHFLDRSSFRARFEAKGRMQALVASIPTYVIEAPHAAMVGDLIALAQADRRR